MSVTPHGRLTTFQEVVEVLREYPMRRVAVSVAESASVLEAAAKSYALGLAEPILYGDESKIRKVMRDLETPMPDSVVIHNHVNYIDAAAAAATAVSNGEADMLMKGQIHTDDFLRSILNKDLNLLERGSLLSHVFVLEASLYNKFLLVTDAAVNIQPDLEKKARIAANAIFLAQVLGVPTPNVAVLSAVEVVNPSLPSSIDAGLLAKMADRHQISYGKIDGPFALDNALSIHAAHEKNIESPVAGEADILLVPDLVSGNILAKSFVYLAGGTMAGIVLGAKVPIVLPSRADSPRSKLMGIAIGVLVSDMVAERFVKLGKVHF